MKKHKKYIYKINAKKGVVKCIATFAGKQVIGIARCNTEEDQFNERFGIWLATLRCDEKMSRLKYRDAMERLKQYEQIQTNVVREMKKLGDLCGAYRQENEEAITQIDHLLFLTANSQV